MVETKMKPLSTFSFVKEESNVLSNAELLNPFFEKLYSLKQSGSSQVNIVQIGDSHMQTDLISAMVRDRLQSDFGNSGRGLIVPCRVAKTNEPTNYKTSSTKIWSSKRCVFPKQPLPIGVGGITISTNDSLADLTVQLRGDTLNPANQFSKITLFYQKEKSYDFRVVSAVGDTVADFSPDTTRFSDFTSVAYLPSPTRNAVIKTVKADSLQNTATLYGLLLENGQPGVLYHSIGVNGAQYQHYSDAAYFCEQTAALRPDLFILSLGTNEAFGLNFSAEQFYADIQKLVDKLKSANPDAYFVLTTPACSYRKKKPNPRLPIAARTIRKFAEDNHLVCWDLQKITGGDNSASYWKKYHLLRPDGVHYSKTAYELQGQLLSQAIINAYNAYVANRSE